MSDNFTPAQWEEIVKKSTIEISQTNDGQSPASPDPTEVTSEDQDNISDFPDSPDPVLHPDREGQPTTPFAGIPLPSDSLGRKFDLDPLLPHYDESQSKYVSMSRVKMPIRWESLFVLPNLESRVALYFAEIDTYADAMQMSPLEFVRPLETRINHLVRTYQPPPTWDVQSIRHWCEVYGTDVTVDDMLAWAHSQGIHVTAGQAV